MPYQVMFEADFVEQRHRGTTFFRWLLAIPVIIWGQLWLIAVAIVVFIAWFALLFTGRYPRGLYNFVASYIRFSGRVFAYLSLMTDAYPPFDGSENASYPVRVEVAPPLPKYGRWRVFLHVPIATLGAFIWYFASFGIGILLNIVATAPFVQWLVIVNDGRARLSLHRLTWLNVAFQARFGAWLFLMAQDLPPFLREWPRTAGAGAQPPPMPV